MILKLTSYFSPEAFKGKNVLVVGLGNTGADAAVSLIGHANKIYSSHRHGTVIVSHSFIHASSHQMILNEHA